MTGKSKKELRTRGKEMLKEGVPAAEVARRLKVPDSTVRTWAMVLRLADPFEAEEQEAQPAAESTTAESITPTRKEEQEQVFIRITREIAHLKVPVRIHAIAHRAGLAESMISRAALLVGLRFIEKDPALILSAGQQEG